MHTAISLLGKAGAFTTFAVKKTALQRMVGGGAWDRCQADADADLDSPTPAWLQLQNVLQNIPGKGIATILGKIRSERVVIKIQLSKDAEHEIDVQERLKRVPGFVEYLCTFACADDKDFVDRFATLTNKSKICQAKGTGLTVIVMPFFSNGSLEDALLKARCVDVKRILRTCICAYAAAYTACGFTHGDLFAKNIVLDSRNRPTIIDFERSAFDSPCKLACFWRDIDCLLGDVARHTHMMQLDSIARMAMINRAYGVEPSSSVMADLLRAIDAM